MVTTRGLNPDAIEPLELPPWTPPANAAAARRAASRLRSVYTTWHDSTIEAKIADPSLVERYIIESIDKLQAGFEPTPDLALRYYWRMAYQSPVRQLNKADALALAKRLAPAEDKPTASTARADLDTIIIWGLFQIAYPDAPKADVVAPAAPKPTVKPGPKIKPKIGPSETKPAEAPVVATPVPSVPAMLPEGSEKIERFVRLAIGQVSPSDLNPRKRFDAEALRELADSIKKHGQAQPILVRPATGHAVDAKAAYEIVVGERRWRAAQLAKLSLVDVIIDEMSDTAALGLMIEENVKREDLDPIEEAEGYKALADRSGMTQTQIGATVHKHQATIANTMRLLKLPAAVQEQLRDTDSLSRGHGLALLRFDGFPAVQAKIAAIAAERGSPVRDLEKGLPFAYDLDRAGLVGRLPSWGFDFPETVCAECPFGARVMDGGRGWCMKPEHVGELQAAEEVAKAVAADKRIKELAASGAGPVYDYSQFQALKGLVLLRDTRPSGCTEACPCRASVQMRDGSMQPCCIDRKRHETLAQADYDVKAAPFREEADREWKVVDAGIVRGVMDMVGAPVPFERETVTYRSVALLIAMAVKSTYRRSYIDALHAAGIETGLDKPPEFYDRANVLAFAQALEAAMVANPENIGTVIELWLRDELAAECDRAYELAVDGGSMRPIVAEWFRGEPWPTGLLGAPAVAAEVEPAEEQAIGIVREGVAYCQRCVPGEELLDTDELVEHDDATTACSVCGHTCMAVAADVDGALSMPEPAAAEAAS